MKKCKVVFSTEENVVRAIQLRNSNSSIFKSRYTDRNESIEGFKPYAYLCPTDNISSGDMVVVETQKGFSLATFVGYDPITPKGITLKMIVGKVGMNEFLELKQAERRKEELLSLMSEKRKALEETLVLEMLAEKDVDMKCMLEEYKMLNGGK
jgi:hypothetical protein